MVELEAAVQVMLYVVLEVVLLGEVVQKKQVVKIIRQDQEDHHLMAVQ